MASLLAVLLVVPALAAAAVLLGFGIGYYAAMGADWLCSRAMAAFRRAKPHQ